MIPFFWLDWIGISRATWDRTFGIDYHIFGLCAKATGSPEDVSQDPKKKKKTSSSPPRSSGYLIFKREFGAEGQEIPMWPSAPEEAFMYV